MPSPKSALRILLTLLIVCAAQAAASAQAGIYGGSHTFTVSAPGPPACSESFTASFTTVIDGAGQPSTSVSYNPTNNASCFTTNPFYRHAIAITGSPSEFNNPDGSFGGVLFPYSECVEQQTVNGIELSCSDGVARSPYSTASPAPSIQAFTATSPVCDGSASTLSWSSSDGSGATITDLATGAVTGVPASGSMSVFPATSRTYRFTVTNAAGSTTRDVAITVNPPAAINSFSASATTINAGQSASLNFSVSNTSARSITDLSTGAVMNLATESGAITVTPATTRTYRLTAVSGCNAVTQDVTVTVAQAPSISAFAAGASPVCSGGSSTLTWTASGGTSATISAPGLLGSPVSVDPASGSLVVNPASTTTYTLTVSNAAGSVNQTVTVTVTPAPVVGSFSATPSATDAGQSVTLNFDSSNGASATITDLLTGAVSSVPVSGSLSVAPATSRSYRFTVTGPCGTAAQDVAVAVTQAPTISSLTASPASVCPGSSTTLSWASSGGTSATITDLVSGTATPVQLSGTLSVTPATSRGYRLTVTNAAGSVTQDVAVTVIAPASITTFSASATTINPGGSVTFTYAVSGPHNVITLLDRATGVEQTLTSPSGTVTVTPASSRGYQLLAGTGCQGVISSSIITVTVTTPPTISALSATPDPVCAGSPTSLSWTSSGGTSASITDLLTGAVTNNVPVSGSLSVTPASSRAYRLTVTNGAGSTTRDAAVTVTPLAAANSFGASATTINAGQSTNLNFSVSNTTSRTITDLLTGAVTNLAAESGTLTVTPATSRTYRLSAVNGCNTATLDVTITVTQPPTVSSFSAGASPICQGASTNLTWSATGGTSATISGPSLTPVSVNPDGGTLTVTPNFTGTYTLTVTNAAGSVTRTVNVVVHEPAAVVTFFANRTTVTAGDTVTFTYEVSGPYTSIVLRDTLTGVDQPLSAATGQVTVTPASSRGYQIRVTSGCGLVTSNTINITVRQPPAINSFAASASPICPGGSSTLSWNISGATSATISAPGVSGFPRTAHPVSGTLAVTPAATTTYTLTASNASGSVTRTVTVVVATAASITTFSASATAITAGQGVTFTYAVSGPHNYITLLDRLTGVEQPVASPSGTVTVTPASTRGYQLLVNTICQGVLSSSIITVTVASPGVPLIGPRGQPRAVGPTSNNDDYTNMTATSGVAAPFGGLAAAGGVITFTNTALNDGPAARAMTLTARVVPAGFTVEASLDGGATWVSIGAGSTGTTLGPGQSSDVPIRVTYPAGLNVLTGHPIVIRLANSDAPATFNETVNRLWTGFVRADKSQIVTNPAGVGAANAPVRGATIEYVLAYSNVTPAPAGTGNVDLTATNVVFTEDGNAAPNNWAATTTHVAGSASDSLGGAITGDVPGSTLLRDTVGALAPGQSGVFRFRRVIR